MGKRMDRMKGRIKKAAGDLTGDKSLRREGAMDEAKVNAKDAIDEGKRTAEDIGRAFRKPDK